MKKQDLAAIIIQGFLSAVSDENHIAHKSFDGVGVIPHASRLGVYEINFKDGSRFTVEVSSAPTIVWSGNIDGMRCRVMQVASYDCIVERRFDYDGKENWEAVDDGRLCAQVYMMAFLEKNNAKT